MPAKKTKEQFILESKSVHGDLYCYDSVEYISNRTKVKIFCNAHNAYFMQAPTKHLAGQGCPMCARIKRASDRRLTTDEFIKRSTAKHGEFYDYSESIYVKQGVKLTIICPVHGEFQQCPSAHISGMGCNDCATDRIRKIHSKGFDEFVRQSIEVHGNRYKYPDQEYVNGKTHVEIECVDHGVFRQAPECHVLRAHGCPSCANEKKGDTLRSDTESFIERAKSIHGDKFNYDNVEYVNNHTKVRITCDRGHDFDQQPSNHLMGGGCNICRYYDFPGTYSLDRASESPERYSSDGIFYNIEITNDITGRVFHKIGITTNSVEQRMFRLKSNGFSFRIISEHEGTIFECLELEDLVLSELKSMDMLYKVHDLKNQYVTSTCGGWTECYEPKPWYNTNI